MSKTVADQILERLAEWGVTQREACIRLKPGGVDILNDIGKLCGLLHGINSS